MSQPGKASKRRCLWLAVRIVVRSARDQKGDNRESRSLRTSKGAMALVQNPL